MNSKKIILIISVIAGIALLPFLPQYSKGVYSFLKKHLRPAVSTPANRYPAPDFTLVDLNNNDFEFSETRGKVVVLMFWTTW